MFDYDILNKEKNKEVDFGDPLIKQHKNRIDYEKFKEKLDEDFAKSILESNECLSLETFLSLLNERDRKLKEYNIMSQKN